MDCSLFSMQPSQETRVLAACDGIDRDLGLLGMRVVRGNVRTRILHGWGPGQGGGGGRGGGKRGRYLLRIFTRTMVVGAFQDKSTNALHPYIFKNSETWSMG